MDLPFTQFRVDLFTTVHKIFDILSIITNGLLLYLIVFHTAKSFRAYSIILACVTLSEFMLGVTAGMAMTRAIPVGWGLIFQFHGLCRKISSRFCTNVHSITAHCVAYGYSLLPLSFWYRHYILTKPAPQPTTVALICLSFYLPAFIAMVMFALSVSEPSALRQILVTRRNISLYPDDPKQAAIGGYESIFQKTALSIIIWITLPVFPGYTAAIIYRTRILAILAANSMSEKTKEIHKKLVKALTIQAILPLPMMTQATIYLGRQFQIPYGDAVPYFEEWAFLLLSIVGAINPCITIYYLQPYREKVMKMLWPAERKKKYKIEDERKISSNGKTRATTELY